MKKREKKRNEQGTQEREEKRSYKGKRIAVLRKKAHPGQPFKGCPPANVRHVRNPNYPTANRQTHCRGKGKKTNPVKEYGK